MNSRNNFKGFGDSLINFLYSLAKSKALQIWTGDKVSNFVLSQALIRSDLDQPGGLDKHEKGDFVEGYIAQAWIKGVITLDEASVTLQSILERYDLENDEQEAMVEAFKNLLNMIETRLQTGE
ncbi:MAG: hypothetical protein HXS53_13150 [Theionarchaea archaeon]|nr:hypothetical protein [Theionarchaea archaeon]